MEISTSIENLFLQQIKSLNRVHDYQICYISYFFILTVSGFCPCSGHFSITIFYTKSIPNNFWCFLNFRGIKPKFQRTRGNILRGSLVLPHLLIINGVSWQATIDSSETFIQYLIFLNFVILKSFAFQNTYK